MQDFCRVCTGESFEFCISTLDFIIKFAKAYSTKYTITKDNKWKISTPLAHWHAKLNNWHIFGTLACLLERWHIKMRSWNVFGTLARRHVDHAGMHDTYGTWFSKFPYPLRKCKMSRIGLLDHTLCEWCLKRHYFEYMVYGALMEVGRGGWVIILGG